MVPNSRRASWGLRRFSASDQKRLRHFWVLSLAPGQGQRAGEEAGQATVVEEEGIPAAEDDFVHVLGGFQVVPGRLPGGLPPGEVAIVLPRWF